MNNEQPSPIALKGGWYLIQRCMGREKEGVNDRVGVDRVLAFDYMGSAEFEFGCLATSFKKYREMGSAGLLTLSVSSIKTKTGTSVWILHHKHYRVEDVDAEIQKTLAPGYHLKEPTRFDRYIEGSGYRWELDTYVQTWVVVHGSNDFDFVIWGLDKPLLKKLLDELKKPSPTRPEEVKPKEVLDGSELRMFDPVVVESTYYRGRGKIVSIYESSCDVLTVDGRRMKGVSYEDVSQIKELAPKDSKTV